MIRKLIKIGNSYGVTLDKRILKETDLLNEKYLYVDVDKQGQRIIIRKRKQNEW